MSSTVYDAANLRTSKTVSSVTTHYVYGAGGLLYGEYDASGNMLVEYVYLNGEPLAQIDSGEVLSYLHTDHLGTPRYATNTSGAQVWNWSSDAFGVGAPTGTATVNLRFAGQYFDTESDLHYNWNRYYDPATGRYITSDPIGLAGGLNTFGYVSANPVMYTDPEGLYYGPRESEDYGDTGYVPPKGNCGCLSKSFLGVEDITVLSAVGVGVGATGPTSPTSKKPRSGVAGGGPSGDKTSPASKTSHEKVKKLIREGKADAESLAKAKRARKAGRKVIKKFIPSVGLVLIVYNVYEYVQCSIQCTSNSKSENKTKNDFCGNDG